MIDSKNIPNFFEECEGVLLTNKQLIEISLKYNHNVKKYDLSFTNPYAYREVDSGRELSQIVHIYINDSSDTKEIQKELLKSTYEIINLISVKGWSEGIFYSIIPTKHTVKKHHIINTRRV